MNKVALIVIYNHRFDANIEVVKKLYAGRFSHIFHLMPFYTGDRPNVIPVYEGSYCFQGFVAQGFKSFHREDFTHYFFISDDLVLNPTVTEHNFQERMGLPDGACFLPTFNVSHRNHVKVWSRTIQAIEWDPTPPGLQAMQELPPAAEACARLARHGVAPEPLLFRQVWPVPKTLRGWMAALFRKPGLCWRYAKATLSGARYTPRYPLVGGYSDTFIVTREAIREFTHYCGVFASSQLFVEHAIPTALALSAKVIVTGDSLRLSGRALWTAEDLSILEQFDRSLQKLMARFPSAYLFLHPIKFSRWVNDLGAAPGPDSAHRVELDIDAILGHSGYRNQLVNLRLEEGALAMESTGRDPHLFLPRVPLTVARRTVVSLDLTVPSDTVAQLFYQRLDLQEFRESLSVKRILKAGRHRIEWQLEGDLTGDFRLDPGSAPGLYRLHGISFTQ